MLDYRLPDSDPDDRARADAEFCDVSAALARLSLRAARAALQVERTGTHLYSGAASISDYAERRGMSAANARKFLLLGHAIAAHPELEAEVENGSIPVDSAALLGEVDREGLAFHRPEDKWGDMARTLSTRRLRHLVQHRRDETRAGEEVTLVTAYVTLPVKDDLDRAVVLTSRRAPMRLTLGQTLGMVVNDWLDDHDELRRTEGTRRLPDTATIPGGPAGPPGRSVPAEVNRQVRRRSDDRCIVPFCDNGIWLHRSHRVPHSEGGSREADGLDLLCGFHHALYEKGLLRITGPADDPEVTDPQGRPMDARIPLVADSLPDVADGASGPSGSTSGLAGVEPLDRAKDVAPLADAAPVEAEPAQEPPECPASETPREGTREAEEAPPGPEPSGRDRPLGHAPPRPFQRPRDTCQRRSESEPPLPPPRPSSPESRPPDPRLDDP